ncbi:MAG: 2-hydroxychromene-2-carboxylate isomerase [Burkholderiales bacterium]|nr:2-hydroxychromene-2-carboxylate isomerase [Burkholderiales bacterium]
MKHITFYLDFISPYAYLAFEALPQALMGLSYTVTYKPVLFAALLKHHGQLGPAEIPAKRDWTYRQVQWVAHSKGIALDMPAAHPFNPLGLLRLAVATDPNGQPNRYVCETLLHHVWVGGADAADLTRLTAIDRQLAPARDPSGEPVKSQLRAHVEEAIAWGVFGVPAFVVDGKVFWGLDSLPMLRAYLEANTWFEGPHWEAARAVPVGQSRQ